MAIFSPVLWLETDPKFMSKKLDCKAKVATDIITAPRDIPFCRVALV